MENVKGRFRNFPLIRKKTSKGENVVITKRHLQVQKSYQCLYI